MEGSDVEVDLPPVEPMGCEVQPANRQELLEDIQRLITAMNLTKLFYRTKNTYAYELDGCYVVILPRALPQFRQDLYRRWDIFLHGEPEQEQEETEEEESWVKKVGENVKIGEIVRPIAPELMLSRQRRKKYNVSGDVRHLRGRTGDSQYHQSRRQLRGSNRLNWRDPSPDSVSSFESESVEDYGYVSDQLVSDSEEFWLNSRIHETWEG
jgi:hypothetical protein